MERNAGDREETGDVCRERTPQAAMERVTACLEGRKDLLLFLFLKAEEVEAVHMDISAHKFFHSRRKTRRIFCCCNISYKIYLHFLYRKPNPAILCEKILKNFVLLSLNGKTDIHS